MKRALTAILFAIACAFVPANAFTMDLQGGIANHVSELSSFNMSFYLPVATGDFGYMIGSRHQMFWRAGGGLDIKNGDLSSILVMAGYQFLNHVGHGYVYLHAGILVEI